MLDLILKGMDGIEAAEQIHDRFDVPVVYVTASLDEERLEKTKVTEPYGYITKPFEDMELRPVIEMALQRHKLEKALHESESQYRSIFDSATDSFLIFDTDGNIVEANIQACKMYGYPYGELIKLSGKDIVHRDYCHLFEQFKRDVQRTGEFHAESVDVRKDGTTFDIEVRGTLFNYKYKPHLLAVIRDIFERKQMEEKQRLFSHAVDSSIDGLAMGDLEGRITYVNDAFVRMFGYSREELIGNEIAFIYLADQLPKLEKALKATMDGGWIGELVARRKNGELFPIAITSSLITDDEGNPIAHMASHQDISELKKKKNKELELFNRLTVGRELKMIERKKEINALLEDPGKEPRYEILGES